MGRTIRIDDEVWKYLQLRALPLVDTPNDVLKRLLGINKPAQSSVHDNEVIAGTGLVRSHVRRVRKARLHPPVKNEYGGVLDQSIKAFTERHDPPIKYEGMRNAIDVLTACKSPNGENHDFHYEVVKYVEDDGVYVRRMPGVGYRTSNEEMHRVMQSRE